jgi:DeoR/GlpR family transcriptional regulator of sugar metabolism
MNTSGFHLDTIVDVLKTIAEPTRLRILKLLAEGDLTVSELTGILGQSQPRVSRHLKLMLDSRLIKRQQEGSWALFRLSRDAASDVLVQELLSRIDTSDETISRDAERLAEVKLKRREKASTYFSRNAASWDEIRSHHVADKLVEEALLKLVGDKPVRYMLDLGTGTGRLLELFSASINTASASIRTATCSMSPAPISMLRACATPRCASAMSTICRSCATASIW